MVFEEFHSSPVSHMEEPIATERSTSYRVEASLPITRELREQFLCPICYDTIENAHRVFPCLRKYEIVSFPLYSVVCSPFDKLMFFVTFRLFLW